MAFGHASLAENQGSIETCHPNSLPEKNEQEGLQRDSIDLRVTVTAASSDCYLDSSLHCPPLAETSVQEPREG